jgi:hypothetical protein
MEFDLIIIILSSANNEYQKKLKLLQESYLKNFSNIKYLFAELNTDPTNVELNLHHICIEKYLVESYQEINNTIYFKNEQSQVVGETVRLALSIDYINDKYKFKYILVINLNDFLNIPLILKYINTLPENNIYSGYQSFGCVTHGLFLDRNSGIILIDNYRKINYLEDKTTLIITEVMNQNNIYYIPPNKELLLGIITDEPYILNHTSSFLKYYQTFSKYNKIEFDNNLMIISVNNKNIEMLNLIYFVALIKFFYKKIE